MRVSDFIVSRNICLRRVDYLCEYLHFSSVNVNSKISEDKIELWDLTLDDKSFFEWFKIKITLEKIEINKAKNLVNQLIQVTNIQDCSMELCERIINAYSFLISKSFYRKEDVKMLMQIINSEKLVLEKILLLKNYKSYTAPTVPSKYINKQSNSSYSESSYDPYENFSWGGLSGEEAYIGYWNTQ